MTSGSVAVAWGASLTNIGGNLVDQAVQQARHAIAVALELEAESASTPSVSAPAASEAVPDYRPAWYRWQAADHGQGDQIPDLGRLNMVVLTPDGLGITSSAAEPTAVHFAFQPLSEVSVSLRLHLPSWNGQRITLLSGRAELVAVEFSGSSVIFGDHSENYRSAGCNGENDEVQLTLSDAHARLWCNGRFVGMQLVRRLPLSRVRVSGLERKRDYLYSIVARAGV